MVVLGPILTLSASAPPATFAVLATVAAMGVEDVFGVATIAANAGVTQAQVDASRVIYE